MLLAEPLYRLPFDSGIAEALEDEFRALPRSRRFTAIRKMWQREGLLHWNGQAARRRERVPGGVRRVLWVCTWTTVGDAVLDLAARSLVPPGIELDLCIAPSLAPLFAGDARFRAVHVDPGVRGADFDFVLLDVLSTPSIRLKTRHFGALPWATLRGHLLGERFDRAAFGDRRVRQLFGVPGGEVVAPWLTLDAERSPRRPTEAFRIAIPLGARLPEKRYPAWGRLFATLIQAWPAVQAPPPMFVLVGHGRSAREDLATLDPAFVARHAEVAIDDRSTLREAACTIAGCDAFLGIDGGLMHVAIALGVPGLAVFARVDPRWFLRPGGPMEALRIDGAPAELEAERLAGRFIDALRGSPARIAEASPAFGCADPAAKRRVETYGEAPRQT